jgi:adenylylsulfate kinase
MAKKGFTVWFTGLPFSGKKALAKKLSQQLRAMGYKTKLLIGGDIRRHYEQGLGFSKEEVYQNIRRICFECQMLTDSDVVAIAVTISPFKALRDECRNKIGRFIEVYHKCPIDELKRRDTNNFFINAESGVIQDVAGISYPYEEPDKPEVLIHADQESEEQGLEKIIATLCMLDFVTETRESILSEKEEMNIRRRLKELGYL